MSDKQVLVSRPNHDESTNYLYVYAEDIVKDAEDRGITVLDFKGKRANRSDIQKVLGKQKPKFAFFNGHGDDKTICGHRNEALISKDKDENLLKSKIVYSLACNSAKELGKSCVDNGTKAYVGYNDTFIFARDNNKTCTPLEDELARPCLFSSSTIAYEIIKGKTVKEACEKSIERIDEFIKDLSYSGAPLGAENVIMALVWNRTQLQVLGNKIATF